ncbi:hypothetical protein [Fundidesulfovibrio soli]|uniref:hypothetical protein n=1 Tax=Fundidesulfovibrio soli TaxID=2922716 RepID=UPI001FAFF04D|nr:hypothetical protein [Fundidesulfovibrio soli]
MKWKHMFHRNTGVVVILICLDFLGFNVHATAQHPATDPNYQASDSGEDGISCYDPLQVFAFNDLGMHCYDQDFSVFSLLPPFNVVHSQVVIKGAKPRLLNDTQVNLTYRAIADPSGSINTTSIGKTNFWTYITKLYGVTQPPDTGILGYKMPNANFGPQALTPYDPNYKWFSATGIPTTNIDDKLNINSFTMMKVRAVHKIAFLRPKSLDIVLPASSEMNCASCHETAAFVPLNPGSASDASPPPRLTSLTPDSFSTNPDANIRFRENILILHDALNATTLYAKYLAGNPTLCASCHYSKALDLGGTGPQGPQLTHIYLSRGMHKHHGTSWPMLDGMGTYVVPIPGTGVTQCYYCHPGNDTQCLRSVMAVKGMQCQSCHGELLQVGGFTPNLGQPGFVDPYLPDVNAPNLVVNLTTTGAQRRPWVDMPKCQSCHSGDALSHLGDNLIGQTAYDPNDPAATSLIAPNQRFAENPGQLFRFSGTHGGMACQACHGSPHAEWPARSSTNDNITATQIQGHTGEIAECGACHLPLLRPSLGGPHGLHNVNDAGWMRQHGFFMRRDRTTCMACHGTDLNGTALSRAKDNRTLHRSRSLGGVVNYTTGTQVSCYSCHTNIIFHTYLPQINLLLQNGK